jgi:hypothetical protein
MNYSQLGGNMPPEVTVAIIQILPPILAILTILILAAIFRKPLEHRLLPRLSGIKILGVEISLLKEELDEVASARGVAISEGDKWSALKRAEHVSPVLQSAKILWVDDEPQRNRQLVKILISLGTDVDHAQDTDEALKLLRRHQYDVVISDIKRGEGGDAGLKRVSMMWDEHIYRWTIFYVSDLKPGIPEHAFNITNRPDHLLHFIMDALERDKWSDYSAQ